MKQKYKGVIFDMDGTLVDTLEDIAASMNKALKFMGFPELPVEDYLDKVGWGTERLAFLALPEKERQKETASRLAAQMSLFYAEAPLVYTKPYPGIPELVSALRQRKIKIAVLTNKTDPVAQKVAAGLFHPGSFDRVQGGAPGRPLKPDPESVWELLVELDLAPSDSIFVGDSEVDIETAVSSGCFPLGVSWGYRSRETITQAGARLIIEKPEELLGLLA
jgi:phosphoglycolate phosphatase